MTHWLAVLLILWNILPFAQLAPSARAAQTEPVTDQGVSFRFGQDLTFKAKLTAVSGVTDVALQIMPSGQPASLEKVAFDQAGEISAVIETARLSLRPFTEIAYRYQVTYQDGSKAQSLPASFQYEDNRFEWQSIIEKDFEVFWYGRDSAFGQQVINTARDGLAKAITILAVPPPAPLRIYVYTTRKDLQSAWPTNNQPWVAGFAQPDVAQVLISIPVGPEQGYELERQVPHEILHVLQYQVIGTNFASQPVWLLEGMASLAELYPNPEYQRNLTASVQKQELIPIRSFCQSFPQEMSGAYKAYAESESFVRFLYARYGASGMQKLIDQYNNGLGCEEGVMSAFGVSLDQLEYRWKQETLGVDPVSLVLGNLMPYILLLAVLLVPALAIFLPFRAMKKPGATA